MISEELLVGIILVPLLLATAFIGCLLLVLLWVLLPKGAFSKIVEWLKKLKGKLQDDNV